MWRTHHGSADQALTLMLHAGWRSDQTDREPLPGASSEDVMAPQPCGAAALALCPSTSQSCPDNVCPVLGHPAVRATAAGMPSTAPHRAAQHHLGSQQDQQCRSLQLGHGTQALEGWKHHPFLFLEPGIELKSHSRSQRLVATDLGRAPAQRCAGL